MSEHFIKIGELTFENIKVYSKNDKIRDKYSYECTIGGMSIRVCNEIKEGKISFRSPAVKNGYWQHFVKTDLTAEQAIRGALRLALSGLDEIKSAIDSSLKPQANEQTK